MEWETVGGLGDFSRREDDEPKCSCGHRKGLHVLGVCVVLACVIILFVTYAGFKIQRNAGRTPQKTLYYAPKAKDLTAGAARRPDGRARGLPGESLKDARRGRPPVTTSPLRFDC